MHTLNVVLVGIVVVFAVLTLLILCIKIYSAIIAKFSGTNNTNNKNNSKEEVIEITKEDTNSTVSGINPELIAVITAAIAASMGGSSADLKVKSIKRIGHTTPIWNVAGRNEYILSKL